ncbi:nucleotide cyclase [Lucifera butyrica]|uniref:Nucleotide cyclase n=1 Tax=Lucifera butyrica TaxID=1351585 RepID=A0A498RBI8_9FIRM|nr:PleD family two-component system response regulator [Lucifera butyrica]VBB08864.1 nucleotide cyclase [Lucifera butyrica]
MNLERQSVLIVDDSRLNLMFMKDILKDRYKIFCATSGKQALAITMAERVDLIILDVTMPDMDGYEVCEQIKKNPQTKNIPVIFVSAMEEEENEAKGLEIGAIDYIIKPFNPSILKARVKNHLELKKYRDILEKLSLVDGLTGLANRRYFDEVLDKEWRRALRNGDNLSIILLDVDFFKKYNDHYGHLAGDDCLRQVGNVLKDSVKRAGDLAARYGGEEFAVILPSTPWEGAFIIAEKMRRNIESLQIAHQVSEVSSYVTISVGVASLKPEMDMIPDILIRNADDALYQAKRNGRNKVCLDKYKAVRFINKNLTCKIFRRESRTLGH